MRVAVTGGAGFVGSLLVPTLLELGHEVLAVDNLSTGKLDYIPNHSACHFAKGDLRENGSWVSDWRQFKPQWVINLAAVHYIPYCNKNWQETVDVNVAGFQRVLELSESAEVVAAATSAAVYGPNDNPHRETETMAPTDVYGLTKQLNEHQLHIWSSWFKVPVRALRFFNIYGPRETNPHLIPEILQQAATGDRIELGNLETKRDYIYVADIVSGVLKVLETVDKNVLFDAYNIGTGLEYNAREVVEAVANAMGRDIQAVSVPERYRPSDRPHLCADISKMNALGWSPKYSLQEGLRELVSIEAPALS
jgi:UDP-glucose 4-epimerase